MAYIDLLSVFIAAISAFILAFFYFSSWLFGPGIKKERHIPSWKSPGRLILSFCMLFLIAFFLAFIQSYFQVVNFFDGLTAGAAVFAGLVLPLKIMFFLWSKRSFQLFFIETVFWALVFLIMGGVLAS